MKWKEMTTPYKLLRVISLTCLVAGLCLIAYEIAGWRGAVTPWETGERLVDILLGTVFVSEGLIYVKKGRSLGIIMIALGSLRIISEIFFWIIL